MLLDIIKKTKDHDVLKGIEGFLENKLDEYDLKNLKTLIKSGHLAIPNKYVDYFAPADIQYPTTAPHVVYTNIKLPKITTTIFIYLGQDKICAKFSRPFVSGRSFEEIRVKGKNIDDCINKFMKSKTYQTGSFRETTNDFDPYSC